MLCLGKAVSSFAFLISVSAFSAVPCLLMASLGKHLNGELC
jgi:hypothetical protein